MEKNDIYKIEKQIKLVNDFNSFIKDLNEKYNNSLSFYIYYDTILINTKNKEIKENIGIIIDSIISCAKESLDEEFYLPTPFPIEVWSSYDKQDLSYGWTLQRKLKEDEPA